MESPRIRKATADDIEAVAGIYDMIHEQEAKGNVFVGWKANVYPTRETAKNALIEDSLFVMESDGMITASAIINHRQLDAYKLTDWLFDAADDKVGVLHTLVVNPDNQHSGLGKIFVNFFEEYCKEIGCKVVRLDTQEQNLRPLQLYTKMGYRKAGIYDTCLKEDPESKIRLVMFEKCL